MNKNTTKAKFIMSAAAALHRYGTSSDKIERAARLISEKLGLTAEFMSTPTSLIANFDFKDQPEYTSILRMDPGKINLEKLCSADRVVDLVLDSEMDIEAGERELNDIISRPPLFSNLLVNVAISALAFSAAIFLKGSLLDAFFCGIISLVISVCTQSIKQEKISTIAEALIAFALSFTALSIHKLGIHIFPPVAILASLLFYLPGLMFTMAIHELSSDNLQAGTARLTGALIILLKLAFGTYLGSEFSAYLFGTSNYIAPIPLGLPYQILSIFLVSLAFSVSFQAEVKNFIWIVIGCFASFYSAVLLQDTIGVIPSAFVGGLIVGCGSNLFSIVFQRPAMVLSLPMIILLVPGSVGYQGLSFFFEENPLDAISTIFKTISIGMALVAGSFFGNLIIPPKRAL
ncbi:MAG: hypothetical protein CME62_05560 [Halobacteriovoraceae bacterium]|nr:hypothetical protein [Halobacteriovoraceae bacterium]|tara:strand:- start:12910 stop:14118 length:1209 start_codon:yes stop_codon:yes gene_type:complete